MSILIEGMEMPKETTLISIGPGGTVEIHRNDDLTWVPLKEKAVPVPPHGRLIDADALCASHKEVCSRSMKFNLDLAPTIIPADESNMDSFIRIFEEDDEENGMDSFIRILKD